MFSVIQIATMINKVIAVGMPTTQAAELRAWRPNEGVDDGDATEVNGVDSTSRQSGNAD